MAAKNATAGQLDDLQQIIKHVDMLEEVSKRLHSLSHIVVERFNLLADGHIVYDFTDTRERKGPERFLKGFEGLISKLVPPFRANRFLLPWREKISQDRHKQEPVKLLHS